MSTGGVAIWRYAKKRMRARVDNPFVFANIIDPGPDRIPIRPPRPIRGWHKWKRRGTFRRKSQVRFAAVCLQTEFFTPIVGLKALEREDSVILNWRDASLRL
jgi:hypothetical protein